MNSHKVRALRRVLGLGALLGAFLLVTPVPAQACTGGDYWECRSYWLDNLYYPCLAFECAGLSGAEYRACRQECWQAWIDQQDCSNCPY